MWYGAASGVSSSSEQQLTASDAGASDSFGVSVAPAGDLDQDGYDDLAIGAQGVDDPGARAGAVYLYFGAAGGLDTDSEDRRQASDTEAGDSLGSALGGAGDFDGDGRAEVVFGVPFDDDSGSASGAVVVLGLTPSLTASDNAGADYFSFSLAGAGDVDGDGYDDVIVGAYGDDDGGASSGSAYVYYGSATGLDLGSEAKLTASDAGAGDRFGGTVAGAGDVDGDGYDDVLVGAQADTVTGYGSGSVYVYLGAATGVVAGSEQKLSASDAALGDNYGIAISSAGDLDADGFDDIVVGSAFDDDGGSASGSVYVYYGSASGPTASSEQKLVASDSSTNQTFGYAVAGLGDVDGDGYSDVGVGARGDTSLTGAVYVYRGSVTGLASSTEVKITASGGTTYERFGQSIGGGDLDGDGYDDLLVGAPYDGDAGSFAGAAYMYRGGVSGIDPTTEVQLTASNAAANDFFGHSVAVAGDLNGDGYDDVVVGAYGNDDGATDGGAAYVWFGAATGLAVSSEAILVPPDISRDMDFGRAVSGAGDLDGDGADDLLVGALGVERVYVFSGGCRDLDGDGFCGAEDCDDTDATIHPDATEVDFDGVDSDCDGVELCYVDADGDGATDGSTVVSTDGDCADPGEATSAVATGDCDDTDATIGPDATETTGDEVDSDCDGTEVCFADADTDGYTSGTVVSSDTDCADPGEATVASADLDCDDTDSSVHPGATEGTGDGVDADCDGTEVCFVDADTDGYTDGVTTTVSADTDCTDVGEASATDPTGDCDDTDATVHPGATEGGGRRGRCRLRRGRGVLRRRRRRRLHRRCHHGRVV